MKTKRVFQHYRLIGLFLVLLGVGLPVMAIAAQRSSPGPAPAIVIFQVKGAGTFQEVESASSQLTFTWSIAGMQSGQTTQLQALVNNQWVALETNIAAQGSLTHIAAHPLGFADPVYRLVIVDANHQTVAEQYVNVPYTATNVQPKIAIFQTTANSVNGFALQNRTARIPVNWQINNRTQTSQIVFEQIVNNQPLSIELPREQMWIRSISNGVVAPVATGQASITLQMRLIDVLTGATYDQQRISLRVDNTPPPASPTHVPVTVPPPMSTPTSTQTGIDPRVISFTVSPKHVVRGGTITVSWKVRDLPGVKVVVFKKNQHYPGIEGEPVMEADYSALSGTEHITLPTEIEIGDVANIDLYTEQPLDIATPLGAGGMVFITAS